jgi:peptidoglycan hydrolase-like protein with peptidoglycan-binding domain
MATLKFNYRKDFGWGPTGASSARVRQGIAPHYVGASRLNLKDKSHSHCISTWKGFRTFHMGPQRGWADIGYAWGICPHGIVMEGRGFDRVQAAQPGGNSTFQSVQFMIGGNEQPTPEAIEAFKLLRAWLRSRGVGAVVRDHGTFISTSCAGGPVRALIANGTLTGGAPVPSTGGGSVSNGGMTSVRSIESQQKIVNAAGYTPRLVVDGDFGPLTEAGVKWYQKKIGVDADGLWGRATENAHDKFVGVPNAKPVPKGPNLSVDGDFGPKTIKALQDALGVKQDGVFGPKSKKALQKKLVVKQDGIIGPVTVKALQKKLGVSQDGKWGPITTRALQRALNANKF